VTTARPRKFSDDALLEALARGPVSTGELSRTFGVTRQAVLNRLKGLELSGLATRSGDRRGSRWQAPPARRFSWPIDVGRSDEDEMWKNAWNACTDLATDVNDATRSILRYTATEMLNNAVDHSNGTVVTLDVVVVGDDISLRISDDGVGAFPKVRDHFDLPSVHEAVARLTKGRQTTAPDRHSGQGLFFTSKVVDQFEIVSAGLAWSVDNVRDDQALLAVEHRPGTQVLVRTRRDGTIILKDIFDRFAGEDHEFDRATFRVVLGDISDEFVSRSEAKRLGAGLEVYRRVELDFTGVSGVGQGFVDELFRVWANAHSETELIPVNANDAVTFMIERGLGT
jgi:anti-sigma regulatory factor (Ser/Thr protein kinase)/biotin operon repressor